MMYVMRVIEHVRMCEFGILVHQLASTDTAIALSDTVERWGEEWVVTVVVMVVMVMVMMMT